MKCISSRTGGISVTTRAVSLPNATLRKACMPDAYAEKFGQPFDDRYMLYFAYGAPYFEPTANAVVNVQYVMGPSPEDIHRTFLLRDRYYRMLNNGVVDLFCDAKSYAEGLFGRELRTAAHASWAQSPTIDLWNTEKQPSNPNQYEYTSNFVWGNTVHQASAACYDYFKWSEYLQPTGNDFAEGGWGDRNYYGAAMAASIGVINKYPNAYAAAWGMPDRVWEWKMAINSAFGAQATAPIDLISGHVHRDVDVLILYPMNLVAVEPRFGSWMAQYGYANYLTADKLLEMGKILPDGRIQVGDKKYGTLVAVFEPLPEKGLLEMMERFVESGGRVVWFSAPPLINTAGENCAAQWQKLFGATYRHDQYMGEIAAGKEVAFCGSFAAVPRQTVLTDFLVDRIYPVEAGAGCEVVARADGRIVGTIRKTQKGSASYFGFRPRDDQSASLGYETRTLFEILHAVGAYPSSGKFGGVNDNPSVVADERLFRHGVPEYDDRNREALSDSPRKLARRILAQPAGGCRSAGRESAAVRPDRTERCGGERASGFLRRKDVGRVPYRRRWPSDRFRRPRLPGDHARRRAVCFWRKTFRSGGFCSRGRGFSGLPDLCFGTGADCAAGSGDGEKSDRTAREKNGAVRNGRREIDAGRYARTVGTMVDSREIAAVG